MVQGLGSSGEISPYEAEIGQGGHLGEKVEWVSFIRGGGGITRWGQSGLREGCNVDQQINSAIYGIL